MLPLRIGLRYARARKGQVFLSFISAVSFFGLVLGVVALTVVVSVMNGFDRELKRRILGAVPHVVLEGEPGELEAWAKGRPEIAGSAQFLRRSGVVVHGRSNRLVSIFGIVPELEANISIIPAHLVSGDITALRAGTNRVIMGRGLAFQLGVRPGEVMTVIVPEPSRGGAAIRPRLMRVEVAGLFEVDSEVDYNLMLVHVDDLKGLVDAVTTTLRLTFDDIFLAPAVAAEAMQADAVDAAVDWTDEFGDFFETVRMEKTMMFVLLTLIVAIAAFNIISSLSMMVKEKQSDIAVFRTLGLAPAGIMLTFVTQGAIVGVLGTLIGIALGVPLAVFIPEIVSFFEHLVGARMLAGTYFERLPSEVRMPDVVVITLVSLAISLAATVYPAYRASRLQPAAVLRYE